MYLAHGIYQLCEEIRASYLYIHVDRFISNLNFVSLAGLQHASSLGNIEILAEVS